MKDQLTLFQSKDNSIKDSSSGLKKLKDQASVCKKCPLHVERNTVVFGEGNPNSPKIMLVGEAPGAKEDLKGLPFVGAAGKILDGMLEFMEVTREEVYITNSALCRPPSNRKPTEDELANCKYFLDEQIRIIQPYIIIALGHAAAQTLCNSTKSISSLRGSWLYWKDSKKKIKPVPVRVTYHPAYLLKQASKREEAKKDLTTVVNKIKRKEERDLLCLDG